uniref:Ig-like domain-containing protein n=1 Tax=Cyprinus carpio carpio TaxID=630221 RepID=A0A9J8B9N5_CYPCA
MAEKCHLCLLGLIILSSLLKGTSGEDETHVFISSGENVRLRCNNALHGCKSTTWLYNRFIHSGTVEVIGLGIKKKHTESHERLSLGSDCSLNIKNVTKRDYGSYICQQWTDVNGQHQQEGTDAYVFLHVLHVSSSSSSSQTGISAGRSLTLSCQLYSYSFAGVSCYHWISSDRIQLFWVNQAGVKFTISDSRYQILFSAGHCISTLNTTLLNEDDIRGWKCEVTHRNQLKTSAKYTVRISAQAVIPVHNTKSTLKTAVTSTQGTFPTLDASERSSPAAPDSTTQTPASSSNSETTSGQTTAAAPSRGSALLTHSRQQSFSLQARVFSSLQSNSLIRFLH